MGKRTFVISDTHFSHRLMVSLRGFSTPEEMDECMISHWNSVVKEGDRVYHLGDFCLNRAALGIAARLNGNIVLIKGNHDIFKLKDHAMYFDDLRAYKYLTHHKIILSHIPIHPGQLENRWNFNIHGHIHEHSLEDKRYVNVCVEKTQYKPILLDEIIERTKQIAI